MPPFWVAYLQVGNIHILYYVYHMLSVVHCGYDNDYGEKYASYHSKDDLNVLKSYEDLISVIGGEHEGSLYGLLIATPASLADDQNLADYFNDLITPTRDVFRIATGEDLNGRISFILHEASMSMVFQNHSNHELNLSQYTQLESTIEYYNRKILGYEFANVWDYELVDQIEALDEALTGSTAVAFGFSDQVAPAKVLKKFITDTKKCEFLASVLDGRLLDAKETEALASIPSKEEIYAKMLGCVNSPATGVVGSINAVMSSLVRAINAVKDQKSA